MWEIYEGHIQLDEGVGNQDKSICLDAGTSDDVTSDIAGKDNSHTVGKEHEDESPSLPASPESSSTKQLPTTIPRDPTSNVGSRHVMISYQWDSQWLMIPLKDKLKDAGYNVWMDVEKMGKVCI